MILSLRSLAELIRQLDENGTQEMTLSLLDANNQGGLDMFPPPSSDHPLSSSSGTSRHWDPWSSPNNCGLGGSGGGRPMPSSIGQRVRRSNSLTPPSNNAMAYPQDVWNNVPVCYYYNLSLFIFQGKNRQQIFSFSLE